MADLEQQHHSVARESDAAPVQDNAGSTPAAVEHQRSTNSSEDADRHDSLGYPTPKTPDLSAGAQPVNDGVPALEETLIADDRVVKQDKGIGSVKSHHSSRSTSQQRAAERDDFDAPAVTDSPQLPHSDPTDESSLQTPEDYAAAVEEMRRECQLISMGDNTLEERLQVYSEVVSLRKELAVVQEDERRLRQQLGAIEAVVAATDLTVGKDVLIFEDEAQQSSLQKVWVQESQSHNPDTMEWAEIDTGRLRERVEAARKAYAEAVAKADKLYEHLEEAINETTEHRDREKATITADHEREMESLGEARNHARQVATEKSYHRHRGTAKAPAVVVPKDKERTMRQRRVGEVEFRTTEQVGKMRNELTELMEQVKTLKRHLDDSRQVTEAKRQEYDKSLKIVEEEGAEAREMKQLFLKEEEELKELKADLQGVLHYVRAKNREEEGW